MRKARMECVYCGKTFTNRVSGERLAGLPRDCEPRVFGACSRCFSEGRVRSVEDLDSRCLAAAARVRQNAN